MPEEELARVLAAVRAVRGGAGARAPGRRRLGGPTAEGGSSAPRPAPTPARLLSALSASNTAAVHA